jgi:hypothetical protein
MRFRKPTLGEVVLAIVYIIGGVLAGRLLGLIQEACRR